MKKYVQKILAGIIALAMILGNLAGTGVTVARAAETNDEDEFISFDVQVVDEKGQNVKGVVLQLYRKDNYEGVSIGEFVAPTDSQGKTYYQCKNNEAMGYNVYYEIRLKENSEYELIETPIKVGFDGGEDHTTFEPYTYVDTVNGEYYKGELVTIQVKKIENGNDSDLKVEDKFLEGKVVKEGSTVLEVMDLQLSRVDLSGTPVKFSTNEKGEFKVRINDLADGSYSLQPALGSGYKYSGNQSMKIEIDTRKDENGQNEKYISKVDGQAHSGGAISLSVVEDDSSVVTGVTTETKSVDEKGSKITLTVTGRNLTDSLYYKKYYVKNDGKNKNDVLLTSEKAQKVSAQGDTDTKKTVEVTLPNALEYVGEKEYPNVTGWKIGVDVSADGTFLANTKTGEIAIKKAPVQSGGDSNNNKTDTDTPTKKKVKVSKITISGPSKSIAVGKSVQLTAKVSPAKAANKAVKWTVSNKKYATVTSKGKVTVKKAGAGKTVTVTATAKDGSRKKATYRIKIMKDTVKSIKLKAAKTVKAGKNVKVTATVKTTGKKANKTLQWTSSNSKYATVSTKGVVKTKKAGKNKTVKITAKATDGSNKKYTVKIKIK